ncbi:DNA-binding NarL/FixJ family response regulator [Arthrobacter sp. UYCu712]
MTQGDLMSETVPIRVLLVDDQPLLRMGFRLILEGEAELRVVGEASDGAEAVRRVRELSPDVVLMDVRMPVLDGIEATRAITASGAGAKIIILTTFDLDEYAFAGLQAGASAFLLKDVAPAELVSAVRVVASGDAVVAPRITQRLLETYVRGGGAGLGAGADAGSGAGLAGGVAGGPCSEAGPGAGAGAGALPAKDPLLDDLTPRETEMLGAMAEGLSNSEIAHRYFLSEATVKTHVRRILTKLHLRDRVQAVVYAYETGLVVPSNPDY